MRTILCLIIFASFACQPVGARAACAPQDAAKLIQPSHARAAALTDDDVLAMLDAKLPTDVIVAKINSSPTNFDTASNALKRLKDAGATDAVIAAVLAPREAAQNAARVEAVAGVGESKPEQPRSDQPSAPASVKIPAGVRVELEMAHTIDSLTTRTNDLVSLRVVNPVVVEGVTVVAVGATATARVVRAERNGHWGRAGRITWELKEVTAVDGTRLPLSATGHVVGDSHGAKVAAVVALSVLSPVALTAGFKRGENAVVPEGKRFEAFIANESTVNASVRR